MTIGNLLSRYHPRYVRSLVYMLQQSEYDIRAYLAWYRRTRDFLHVEHRKHLVSTPKALLLLGIACLLLAVLYGAGVLLMGWGSARAALAGIALILSAPFLLAYLIVIPLVLVRIFIQLPVEYFLLKQARRRLANHPGVKIAIAGSFGKTSMREILKTVLSQEKKVAAPAESVNTPLGIAKFAQGLAGDEKVLMFEFGEYYPGDVKKLCGLVDPQWGIITGVNEAHLEKFRDLERTGRTIFELADWLGTSPEASPPSAEKPLYINGESEHARRRARTGDVIYDRNGAGEWRIENARTGLEGTSFMLVRDNTRLNVNSGLLGLHQIGPLAAAADIAFRLGLSLQAIQQGIAATKPFDHRLEPKIDASGVITLDDSYNGNPDGARAVINFLGSLQGHRRWYVTPGLVEMGSRTEQVHKEIGRQLARAHIENVVLIRNSVTPHIAEGLREAHYRGEVLWFDDALAAFAALPHLTVRRDVVLLQNDWPDQYA